MTQTMMPDPVEIVVDGDRSRNVKFIANGQDFPPSGTNLITTTQAEAYKDACVREALESALHEMVDLAANTRANKALVAHESWIANCAANRIRSLISRNDNEQGK